MNYREDERPSDGFDVMSRQLDFVKGWMRDVAAGHNLGLDATPGLLGEIAFTFHGREHEPVFSVRCTVSPEAMVAAYRPLEGALRGRGGRERRFHVTHGDKRAWSAFSTEIREAAAINRVEREPDREGLAEAIARLFQDRPEDAPALLAETIALHGGRDLVEAMRTAVVEAADADSGLSHPNVPA